MTRTWGELLGDDATRRDGRGAGGLLRPAARLALEVAPRADAAAASRVRPGRRGGLGAARGGADRAPTSACRRPPRSSGGSRSGGWPRSTGARGGARVAARRAGDAGPLRATVGGPRRRRQRHRQDDDDRQARGEALGSHGRSVLLAAADTFRAAAEEQLEIWAQRAGADFVGSPTRRRPGRRRLRRDRGGDRTRPRRGDRRHRRPAAHADEPDGGARQGAPRDRRAARGRAARDAARRRRDHRPERPPAGAAVRRGRRASPASR